LLFRQSCRINAFNKTEIQYDSIKNTCFSGFLFFIFYGCQHITDSSISKEIEEANIRSTETFEYHTALSGDEEGAEIIQQAAHYEISKIMRDSTTRWEAVYTYKPKVAFKGTDYVEIKLETGSDGTSQNPRTKIIRIAITVN